jgi:hypothetical protein
MRRCREGAGVAPAADYPAGDSVKKGGTNATRNYFSGEAARALIGRGIRTLVEFSGVPTGTTGKVIRADPTADADSYNVGIESHRHKPLVDWFSCDEYHRFLEEL